MVTESFSVAFKKSPLYITFHYFHTYLHFVQPTHQCRFAYSWISNLCYMCTFLYPPGIQFVHIFRYTVIFLCAWAWIFLKKHCTQHYRKHLYFEKVLQIHCLIGLQQKIVIVAWEAVYITGGSIPPAGLMYVGAQVGKFPRDSPRQTAS